MEEIPYGIWILEEEDPPPVALSTEWALARLKSSSEKRSFPKQDTEIG
jgi:hypothetical protein